MRGENGPESVAEQLRQGVQFLKGVGPRLAPLFQRLGLRTARDLLFFFPRDYEDLTRICPIASIDGQQVVSVTGVVDEVESRMLAEGRSVLGLVLRDQTGPMRAVWFNQPFLRAKVARGQRLMLSGLPKRHGLCWEMAHPRIVYLDPDQPVPAGEILPVYPLTEGLRQSRLRFVVRHAVAKFADLIEEVLPESFRAEHDLCSIGDALRGIHRPNDWETVRQSRRRFIYQELLTLQLALAMRRWTLQRHHRAPALPATGKIDARIRRLFPFELTSDQHHAIEDIARDMGRPFPMNRLLQGEVGSGKTVVAEYAMLLAVAHQHQAVLMAPTEVLARQHFRTLERDLRSSRVRMALLTGSLAPSARRSLLESLEAGEVDLLVGTQALLHESVRFHNLGLVVIDEQHKFGVRQRAVLKGASGDPHYLVMTATPIPRTIALSSFGDLDVSTLRQSPPGRPKLHTYLGTPEQREQWWDFFRDKLREGRQGYVIMPRVEEDVEGDLAGAEDAFERLTQGPLEAFRVDLVHGRMTSSEKDVVMEAFREGRTQVLVATSVIEVGVDVPNATVMTIENGERFGLAQLHQLRGRVARGAFPGYFCVFADATTTEAQERLAALVRTSDGFELAELDFALRGPGDVLGTSQHGMPAMRIADLRRDEGLLQEARQVAQSLLHEPDSLFFTPPFDRLRKQVIRRYGAALDLGDVA